MEYRYREMCFFLGRIRPGAFGPKLVRPIINHNLGVALARACKFCPASWPYHCVWYWSGDKPIDSMHSDWEGGTFQCTPGGNNSIAADGNYMHVSSIFSLKNTLLFVRPLPTPTRYGKSKTISLFR